MIFPIYCGSNFGTTLSIGGRLIITPSWFRENSVSLRLTCLAAFWQKTDPLWALKNSFNIEVLISVGIDLTSIKVPGMCFKTANPVFSNECSAILPYLHTLTFVDIKPFGTTFLGVLWDFMRVIFYREVLYDFQWQKRWPPDSMSLDILVYVQWSILDPSLWMVILSQTRFIAMHWHTRHASSSFCLMLSQFTRSILGPGKWRTQRAKLIVTTTMLRNCFRHSSSAQILNWFCFCYGGNYKTECPTTKKRRFCQNRGIIQF